MRRDAKILTIKRKCCCLKYSQYSGYALIFSQKTCSKSTKPLINDRYEENHIALRHSNASYLAGQLTNASEADMVTMCQYYEDIMTRGKWVGEDVIAMMTDYLRREIHVYLYVGAGSTSPMKYLPVSSATEQPLLIACYEPEPYHCVSKCHPPPARSLNTQTPIPCKETASLNSPPRRETSISSRN